MIIDGHVHIYPPSIAAKAIMNIENQYDCKAASDGKIETALRQADEAGIDKMIINSVATIAKQVPVINKFIGETVNAHPDRLIGFATVHPDCPDLEEMIDAIVKAGFSGIKLHPDFQHFFLNSPKAMRMFDAIAGRLPVLIHIGDKTLEYSRPYRLVVVLRNFPNLDVIAAHLGGWSVWGSCADELAYNGAYVDTSSSIRFIGPERTRELIDLFGADKVIFGTDYPMANMKSEIEQFNSVPMTDEERKMILGDNLINLLNKYNN